MIMDIILLKFIQTNAYQENIQIKSLYDIQPHRYSRTAQLFDDFIKVLLNDSLVILDIYSASERPIKGIHKNYSRDNETKGTQKR